MTGRLLTARALAERLEVRPATVLRWARNGQIPSIRLPSGAVRFREDQIEDRLEQWTTSAPRGVVSLPTITDEEVA